MGAEQIFHEAVARIFDAFEDFEADTFSVRWTGELRIDTAKQSVEECLAMLDEYVAKNFVLTRR